MSDRTAGVPARSGLDDQHGTGWSECGRAFVAAANSSLFVSFVLLSVKVFAACANFLAPVAQISNLLYRRASSLRAVADRARSTVLAVCRLEIGDTADWKSALPWLRLCRAWCFVVPTASFRLNIAPCRRRNRAFRFPAGRSRHRPFEDARRPPSPRFAGLHVRPSSGFNPARQHPWNERAQRELRPGRSGHQRQCERARPPPRVRWANSFRCGRQRL